MITEQAYKEAANKIGCQAAAIKAVAEVESGGAGFVNGKPIILFEPHVFWKELRKIEIDPKTITGYEDMLYPTWGAKPYPKGQDAQYKRLERAVLINLGAALGSCSWGKFQILGNNFLLCGCATIHEFINLIYKDEDAHLQLFTNFIINTYLDDELINLDWKCFASGYNGKYYYKRNYDKKLKAAYNKFSI